MSLYLSGKVALSVGGTHCPKHFGQSGHPIPLPVILTKLPAMTTKKIKTRVIQLTRTNHFPYFISAIFSWNKEHFLDRKSTRLNSSHVRISYAVSCLKK